MSASLEQAPATTPTARLTFVLRFASTIVLWSVALLIIFSGFELAFYALISAVGLIALWEFYGMLDAQGAAEFQDHGDDLRRGHAGGQLLLLFPLSARRAPTISRWRCCSFFC